ncbi:unnamed protein product [Rotaria sp. Silwood1]|nr:unnamed protein product [Rotaria sp. Silwood1]
MNTIHYLEIKQSKLNFISPKIKTKVKILKKSTQPFHYNNITSTTGYSCYPSSFPCFRSCGPINCPENKLPMPRDLWYRIVYSQALEQQLGSGEASVRQSRSASPIRFQQSKISIEQLTNKITKDNSHIDSTIMFEHPLMNQLYEHYNLEDIPRFQLFKQLNRRLTHIHETLKTMSSNDIEIKLKYKHDALTKKRQIPIQSLTKDECIAMAELELNVYEYNKALDKSSSKYFPLNNNDQLENEQLSPTLPSLLSYDPIIPVIKNAIISETSISPSISTLHAVRPSAISQSTALLSTTTQFSEKTVARRYEHICTKAKQLSETQLQAPLEQSKKILQPNKDERLRIAECK